jgi:hypothetical protein
MVGFDPGFQITQRYLNTAAYAGDPSPGNVLSTAQVSGSIVQPYGGFVGRISPMGRYAAAYLADPAAYALFPGNYQYVQFDPLAVQTPATQGQVVFWKNNTTNLGTTGFIVSPDVTGVNLPNLGGIAGIALCNTVAGNYWFIQVAGIAQVKFGATQGAVTPAVGDLVFADYSTPSNLAYDPVQTTNNATLAQLKAVLGVAWAKAPAASTISPVLLGGLGNPKYVPGGGGGEG